MSSRYVAWRDALRAAGFGDHPDIDTLAAVGALHALAPDDLAAFVRGREVRGPRELDAALRQRARDIVSAFEAEHGPVLANLAHPDNAHLTRKWLDLIDGVGTAFAEDEPDPALGPAAAELDAFAVQHGIGAESGPLAPELRAELGRLIAASVEESESGGSDDA